MLFYIVWDDFSFLYFLFKIIINKYLLVQKMIIITSTTDTLLRVSHFYKQTLIVKIRYFYQQLSIYSSKNSKTIILNLLGQGHKL